MRHPTNAANPDFKALDHRRLELERTPVVLSLGSTAGYRPALLRFWLRVIIDHLPGWGRGKAAYRAFHPIAPTGAVFRGHLVIIRRLRSQTLQAHTEHCLPMSSIEPDVTSCCLAQILGVCPVMHHPVMFVESPRVCGGPPDNRCPGVSQFELRGFGYFDMFGPLLRRKDLVLWRKALGTVELSGTRVGEKQCGGSRGDRQFQEQPIH